VIIRKQGEPFQVGCSDESNPSRNDRPGGHWHSQDPSSSRKFDVTVHGSWNTAYGSSKSMTAPQMVVSPKPGMDVRIKPSTRIGRCISAPSRHWITVWWLGRVELEGATNNGADSIDSGSAATIRSTNAKCISATDSEDGSISIYHCQIKACPLAL
jgi:hypothetical protein